MVILHSASGGQSVGAGSESSGHDHTNRVFICAIARPFAPSRHSIVGNGRSTFYAYFSVEGVLVKKVNEQEKEEIQYAAH